MLGDSMLDQIKAHGPAARAVMFPRSGARLHAMVTSAGYDQVADPSYVWDGLRRGDAPYVLLQHTISGQGRLRHGKQRFVLEPGTTLLLRFPHDHRYWLQRGDSWEFFWLCLNGREVLRIWRDAMAVHGPVVRLGAAALERMGGHCLSVLKGEASSPARASAIAYGAAMSLADALLPWGETQGAATRSDGIARAVSLAQARTRDRMDVASLAEAAGYSRYHFSRLFEASEGLSPARYVTRLRMEEAVATLGASSLPIKAVAERCGFADANYFSKVFKRTYGMTPREFRRDTR